MHVSVNKIRAFVNIIQCASAILLNYTIHTDLIHVVSKEDRLDIPVVLWDHIQNLTHPSHPIKPSVYFITYLTERDIELLVENLINDPSFNARAKFIVVAQNLTNKSLEVFGSRFIVDVAFVDIKTGIISTYFPYRRENITDFGGDFVSIGRCLNNGTVILQDEVYPQKEKRSWKNSTIKIMYSPIDVNCIHNRCKNKVMQKEILDEIADCIGIQFTYIRMPSFLMDRENLLHTNFNAIYLGIQINEKHLEYTSYLLTDRFAWFVPSPQPLPRWSYIIKIYYFHTWIIWISTILGVSLIWTIKEFLSFRKLQFQSILIVPRTTFHWFLEQRHSVFLDKLSDCILIFCIFLMTTLMNFFFKCRFTYLLTGVNYEEGINSFEEILSKGLIIGGSQYAIRMINTTPEVADYLVWNVNRCIGRTCLYRTAFEKDQAALLLSSVALSASDMFMDKGTGRSFLHKIAEPTFNIFTVAYFNKGHPLFMLFNKKLFQLREAGITYEIICNYFENIKQVEHSLNTTQSLKLEHIVAPISIWFIGIFFSFIIFFWEVIYGKNVI